MENNKITITIIYDNTAWDKNLVSDWGFACLINVSGKSILFDTGANPDILLANMKDLKIDPSSVDEIFISHHHWDHTGGLAKFLAANPVPVYSPIDFETPNRKVQVITCKKLQKIHERIWSTGILDNIEQSLLIELNGQVTVIAGCSHPGIEKIFNAARPLGKISALIGGLHGFHHFDLIKDIDWVCPTHCTQYINKIRSLYPDKFIEGGAGKVIVL